MSGDIPLPLVSSRPKRDYYQEFIDGSRWLRHEQAQQRVRWLEGLSVPDKTDKLFELEMLLKGLVCFGNPVNHPGPPRNGEPAVARAFKDELGVAREILARIVGLGRGLTAGKAQSQVFQRYLESIIAQDEARFQMVKQSLVQDTPAESLSLLVSSLENLLEVVDGLMSAPHVSFRLFSSTIQMVQREVHRSTFFDPLAALEFRHEFDAFRSQPLAECIRRIDSEPARRVSSLAFLALLRLLKYLDAMERTRRVKENAAVVFGWLAVLRSDTRALTIFFKRDTAAWFADGFGKAYEQLDPESINSQFVRFEGEFALLQSLRVLLSSAGDQLKLEQRKLFEQQLPAIEQVESLEQFSARAESSFRSLRNFLQNLVILLAGEFDASIDGAALFGDFVSKAATSERLRRDIWMFQQILRAFIEKTKSSATATDRWSGMNTFRFVRQFVRYFRSMGYQLLRYSDYEKFDHFINLIDRLRDGDVLETQRFANVVAECEDFQRFLETTFESVGRREELQGVPFDRKEAARTLKLFLKR